jgi:hypothetical protein
MGLASSNISTKNTFVQYLGFPPNGQRDLGIGLEYLTCPVQLSVYVGMLDSTTY